MPVTVAVDQLTVVHQASHGVVSFMPDVCLTPGPPGPPVPIPYPNIAMSKDTMLGTTTVSCDGNPIMVQGSCFGQSTGDEAGTAGGVVSLVTKGKAEFISYSFDVTAEGKPIARMGDLMLGNKGGTFNTPPAPEIQPPLVVLPGIDAPTEKPAPDSLQITVEDGAGTPIKGAKFTLARPDGTTEEGETDASGVVRVKETITGLGNFAIANKDHRTVKSKE